jgi:hypothetical protein
MKTFLLSKLVGWILAALSIAMIFVAGWLLQLAGMDHGRWQSFTMFFPAGALFICGLLLKRIGGRAIGAYVLSGLYLAFGAVVLITG